MFPYVCLATMPLFCNPNWPRKIIAWFNRSSIYVPECRSHEVVGNDNPGTEDSDGFVGEIDKHYSDKNDDAKTSSSVEKRLHTVSSNEEQSSSDEDQEKLSNADKKKIGARRHKDNGKRKFPRVTRRKKLVVALLLAHVALQFFLPYSHFITKVRNSL